MRALLSILFLAAFSSGASAAEQSTLPPGKGQDTVRRNCVGCHALKVVTTKRASKEQWAALVDQMVSRGADVPDEEMENLIDYLSKNFGPRDPAAASDKNSDNKSVNVNKATAAELVDSLGISNKDADAIVAYRGQNGIFKEFRDLMGVPGIETTKLEEAKERLAF